MNNRVIRIGEAAGRLGIHPQTLRRWERQGRVPRPSRNELTGQRRYNEADVQLIRGLIINQNT